MTRAAHSSHSPLIHVMIQAVLKAARPLLRDFGEVEHLQVSSKGTKGFVTSADLRSEKIIREELEKARPGFGFLMEEAGEIQGQVPGMRWIIDPLDGTNNFIHGIPHFSISAALEKNGDIVAGVTYDPIRDEMFWAEKGTGAFLNDRRLRVSARRVIGDAMVGTCNSGRSGAYDPLSQLEKTLEIEKQALGIRRFGASTLDLAYVAAGRLEAFWHPSLEAWDMATGIILVREAGGCVQDLEGTSSMLTQSSILATNGGIQNSMVKILMKPDS